MLDECFGSCESNSGAEWQEARITVGRKTCEIGDIKVLGEGVKVELK